jgi:hypothetical protein
MPNFRELRIGEVRRIHLLRLYEKPSKAGQTPHDEATHGSIYQRFAACTQPLVVFAHPPVPSRKVVRKQAPLLAATL